MVLGSFLCFNAAMPEALLNYHRVGSGSPLVLIHGIGATWQCWKPLLPLLAEQHDVIAVDLPGFGRSRHLQVAQPSLTQMARCVLELLDALEVEQFHVSGNSMGGAVSVELLPSGRVLSYNGISSAGMTYGPSATLLTKPALRATYAVTRAIRPVARPLTGHVVPRAALMALMMGRPTRATQEQAIDLIEGCAIGSGFSPTLKHALRNEPLRLPAWDGPAQMLWGTRDLILPHRQATERFRAAWPQLKIVDLPGLGHVPMAEDPQRIASLITEHTAAVDAAQPADAAPAVR